MEKIIVLAGTRPEAIKMAPLVKQLKAQVLSFEVLVCSSGQHKEMLKQAFANFDISPDINLQVMQPGQSLSSLSAALFASIGDMLEVERPDWLLIQGDTTTAMVGAICAFYKRIRIGHLEAGLRSHNKKSPFPEEINRRVVSLVGDLHFAPTNRAKDNLLQEGIKDNKVFVTGNTVIDALLFMREKVKYNPPKLPSKIERIFDAGNPYILITGHRRESFGQGFQNICLAVLELAKSFPAYYFIYPVHLNPNVQKPVKDILEGHPRVLLIEPQTYQPFIRLLDGAYLVLTDSGGIQEEAPSLGKPVLIMRDVTERPEGIEAGTSKLVGSNKDNIVQEVSKVIRCTSSYASMAHAENPYGDGNAAARILNLLLEQENDFRAEKL